MNWNQLLSDKRFGMEEYHDRKHDWTAKKLTEFLDWITPSLVC
jgi:hypothetical protein